MFNVKKIPLMKMQIWSSFLFTFLLRFIEFSRFFCLSLLIISLLIFLEIWPEQNFLKTTGIIIFTSFNLFFFIKSLNTQKKNFWPNIKHIKKKFQNELNLNNDEIISYDDKFTNYFNSEKSLYLWKKFQSKIFQRVEEQYHFRLKYFFLNREKISISVKISFLFWIIIAALFFNNRFSNNFLNSLSYENQSPILRNFSTNLWIYPPEGSKNQIIFLERDQAKSVQKVDSFLVEKNSILLINMFNLRIKDISIKLRKNKNVKLIKQGISFADQNTIQFKGVIDEGEYSIIIKNKVFHKFNIQIDKKPKIKIISKAVIIDKKFLKLDYKLTDENTRKVWFELSERKIEDNKTFEPDSSILEKLNIKPVNYFLINNQFLSSNNIEEKNSKKFTFERDISNLPISGKTLYMRLGIIDQNDQINKTKTRSFFLPRRTFFDPVAKELIKIRDNLFTENNLERTYENFLKLSAVDKENKIKQQTNNLLNFIRNSKRDKNYKIELILEQTWMLALLLDNNNIKNIEKKIKTLKEELRLLIDKSSTDEELLAKIKKIKELLTKYSELTQGLEDTQKASEVNKKGRGEETHEDLKDNEASIKRDAESLISKIDELFNNDKVSKKEKNKKILSKLQSSYTKQKIILDKTFKLPSNMVDEIINDQKIISKTVNEITRDILKVLPEDQILVMNLNSKISDSLESLKENKKEDAMDDQIKVLKMLKTIYKKILSKSPTKGKKEPEKDKQMNRNKGRNELENSTKKFDTPIIFESNNFDEIIKKIRNMANDQNRQAREKKYLKSLLPKF